MIVQSAYLSRRAWTKQVDAVNRFEAGSAAGADALLRVPRPQRARGRGHVGPRPTSLPSMAGVISPAPCRQDGALVAGASTRYASLAASGLARVDDRRLQADPRLAQCIHETKAIRRLSARRAAGRPRRRRQLPLDCRCIRMRPTNGRPRSTDCRLVARRRDGWYVHRRVNGVGTASAGSSKPSTPWAITSCARSQALDPHNLMNPGRCCRNASYDHTQARTSAEAAPLPIVACRMRLNCRWSIGDRRSADWRLD